MIPHGKVVAGRGPFSNMGLRSAGGPGPMLEAPPLPGAMGKSWVAGDPFSNMGVGSSRDPGPMLENGPFSARQHSIPLPLFSPALTSADQALLVDTHGWQTRGPLLTWVWDPAGILEDRVREGFISAKHHSPRAEDPPV